MNSRTYFPNRFGDQGRWLANFADKLPQYAEVLKLSADEVATCVADCRFMMYVRLQWLPAVRAHGLAATATLSTLDTGEGTNLVALPVCSVPQLPQGVGPVLPGALDRLFGLVQRIKNNVAYTESIGQALGIVGTSAANSSLASDTPQPKLSLLDGQTQQVVRITYRKHGHMGAMVECKRGNGAPEPCVITTVIPYCDDRPLLVPNTPEVRTYRLRYWDDDQASGDWSAACNITVGP